MTASRDEVLSFIRRAYWRFDWEDQGVEYTLEHVADAVFDKFFAAEPAPGREYTVWRRATHGRLPKEVFATTPELTEADDIVHHNRVQRDGYWYWRST